VTQNANPYRFGDLLALARQSWTRGMDRELADRGFTEYRIADAVVRRLRRGPVPVGQLGADLGVTRQAARKVVRALQQRGYASTEPDADDARKLNVILTADGHAYASAIIEVIAGLNRALAARVTPDQLAVADTVLRASIEDDQVALRAERIPPPKRTGKVS
jgi:DNA-binding MarR family transcriptional regulator